MGRWVGVVLIASVGTADLGAAAQHGDVGGRGKCSGQYYSLSARFRDLEAVQGGVRQGADIGPMQSITCATSLSCLGLSVQPCSKGCCPVCCASGQGCVRKDIRPVVENPAAAAAPLPIPIYRSSAPLGYGICLQHIKPTKPSSASPLPLPPPPPPTSGL